MESSGKILMIFGVILFIVGFLLTLSQKTPIRLGKLPGDFSYEKNGVGIYVPFATMILLSILFSVAVWIVSRLTK